MATDTKERLVSASAVLFQRQGLTGTGIKQILAEARAPFSSLYHHFPGGKDELASVAVRRSGLAYQRLVESVWDAEPDVVSGVAAVFEGAATALEESDFADACPIATVALEVASTNDTLRQATAEVFDSWIDAAVVRFEAAGCSADAARTLAHGVVSLLEGAFVLSRAARSTEPMLAAGALASEMVRLSAERRASSSRERP
jgi:AcrR family transcriptional regulator